MVSKENIITYIILIIGCLLSLTAVGFALYVVSKLTQHFFYKPLVPSGIEETVNERVIPTISTWEGNAKE